MRQLESTAPDVHNAFLEGEFVVKETSVNFNQIPDDQALEHCNKTGKVAGSLIGITRVESALNRWRLTFKERTRISEETRSMFNILHDDEDDEIKHKERGSERIKRDNDYVLRIAEKFETFQVFNPTIQDDSVGLTTGDVVTEDIKTDLMNAKLHEFVTERLGD